jgi:hypothetical protein
VDFVEVLEGVATAAGADFDEILLVATAGETAARFAARKAALEAAGIRHPQATVEHDAASIAAIAGELEVVRQARTRARLIDTEAGGADAAYDVLRRLLG